MCPVVGAGPTRSRCDRIRIRSRAMYLPFPGRSVVASRSARSGARVRMTWRSCAFGRAIAGPRHCTEVLRHDCVMGVETGAEPALDDTAWTAMVSIVEAGHTHGRERFLAEIQALLSWASETQQRF